MHRETCQAEDLMDGEVFESHDGLSHEITDVRFTHDSPFGNVVVTVVKSNGTEYECTFARTDWVTVVS